MGAGKLCTPKALAAEGRKHASALEAQEANIKMLANALGGLMDFVESEHTRDQGWAAQREWLMSKGCDALAAINGPSEAPLP